MKLSHLLPLLLCGLFAAPVARAQIGVQLSIKERLHIRHEPVIATVNVTNNTGHDITLSDTPQFQWFSFRINGEDDRMIAPRNGTYHLGPLNMRAGETVKRSVNLNELYELGDFGIYAIRASIYFEGADKFFSSRPVHIELTEGRLIWKQIAGVPEGQPHAGQMRVFSLLAHQRGNSNLLYVRVEDRDDGSVFCTYSLGRMLEGAPPQMQFDSSNNLYVLQLVGQGAYVLSKISPNGAFLGQTPYSVIKTRPYLRKLANGALQLVGAKRDEKIATGAEPPPKLSDRPVGLPMGN